MMIYRYVFLASLVYLFTYLNLLIYRIRYIIYNLLHIIIIDFMEWFFFIKKRGIMLNHYM